LRSISLYALNCTYLYVLYDIYLYCTVILTNVRIYGLCVNVYICCTVTSDFVSWKANSQNPTSGLDIDLKLCFTCILDMLWVIWDWNFKGHLWKSCIEGKPVLSTEFVLSILHTTRSLISGFHISVKITKHF